MNDETETARRCLVVQLNTQPADRAVLESEHGRVWNPKELAAEFEVIGFAAPFAVVKRIADNRVGSVLFQHHPRLYFAFQEDR